MYIKDHFPESKEKWKVNESGIDLEGIEYKGQTMNVSLHCGRWKSGDDDELYNEKDWCSISVSLSASPHLQLFKNKWMPYSESNIWNLLHGYIYNLPPMVRARQEAKTLEKRKNELKKELGF